jgi:hypothetical protein
MKKCLLILVAIFCLVAIGFAQPTNESQRGAYTTEQVRQARMNAEMNRHYESMKPSSTGSKYGNIATNSGGSNTWSVGMDKGQAAASERIAAKEKEWNDKVNKLRKLVAERKIGKSASDYNAFMQAAKESFNDEYTLSRMFPSNAASYQIGANDKNSAFYKEWFYIENKQQKEKEEKELNQMLEQYARESKAQKEAVLQKYWDGQNERTKNALRAAEYDKSVFQDITKPLPERLNAILSLKDNLERYNLLNYYAEKKAKTVHLNYYIADIETKMGRFDEAYRHLLDVYDRDAVNGLTSEELYNLRMYLSIMKNEYLWVHSWSKDYEKLKKKTPIKYEVPYAHFLAGDINGAINDFENFAKSDAINATIYNYCKAALLLLKNQPDDALKFANKTIGTFNSKEALQLVVVDTIWGSAINETIMPNSLVPMSVLFKMDVLKKLEPTSLSIAETSLKFNNKAVRHSAVIEDDKLVVALGGKSYINTTTQEKINKETAENNAKIAEQNRRQAEYNKKVFIDPSIENYVFTNWATATQKFKWEDLTKKDNQIDKSLNENQLNYTQSNSATQIINTQYKIPQNKDWAFSVEYTLNNGKEAYQGIFLTTKGGKDKGKEVLFSMSPTNDQYNFSYSYKSEWASSYSFGEYGNKCSWESLASYNATSTYMGVIPTPNPAVIFNNAGAVTNMLAIKKIGTNLELYINYKLVKTIQINDNIDFLNSITAIGLSTSGIHNGSINKIAFIEVEGNGDGERPIDELWKESNPNAPPKKTVADFEKDIFYLIDLVKTTDVTTLRGGRDINTKTFSSSINFNYPNKGSVYGDMPNGTKAYQNSCANHFEKIMNEYCVKNKWTYKKTEEEVTKKDKKEYDWKCTKRFWVNCYDEKGKIRISLRYCDNDNPRDNHYNLTVYNPNGN